MVRRVKAQSQAGLGVERHCTSCGATLQAVRGSNRTWSLESLLPSGTGLRANLCPACRQRSMEHRIGGFVSARI